MNTYLYHIVSAENRDKESLINEDRIVNEGKGLMMSIARADRIDDAKELTEAVLYLDDNSGMGGMIHISPINNLLTIDKSFGIKAYQHYLRVLHDGLSYAVQNMMDKAVLGGSAYDMFRDINTMLPYEIGSVDSNVLFVFDNDLDNIMTDIDMVSWLDNHGTYVLKEVYLCGF